MATSADRNPADQRRDDARSVRSREALRGALLELIETRPFDAITIRDITEAAGVGYATFYRHYPTKLALLDDCAAAQIRTLIGLSMRAAGGDAGGTAVPDVLDSAAACRTILGYVDQHRALWQALLTGGAAGSIRNEIIQVSREVAHGHANANAAIPDDLVFRFVAGAMVEVLAWWLERADRVPASEGAELLDRLVITPILRPDAVRAGPAPKPTTATGA